MLTYFALHYWAGAGQEYNLLKPQLPKGSRLLAPDLPGYGTQTAPPGFDYSVKSYTDWLENYIDEQNVADYVIIGHSMGGKFALALAARQPAGLRSLVLLAPSPPTSEPISDDDRAASLAAYGQPAEAEKTFAKITNRPLPAEWQQRVVADNLRTSRSAWDAWLQNGSREDISASLPSIKVPCRLLVGTADRAISLATQRQQTLPLLPAGTELEAIPGAGHLLPLEAPLEIFKSQPG